MLYFFYIWGILASSFLHSFVVLLGDSAKTSKNENFKLISIISEFAVLNINFQYLFLSQERDDAFLQEAKETLGPWSKPLLLNFLLVFY